MSTPVWFTGFESGSLSVNGAGLFDTINGTPAVQAVVKRTGNYALQCNAVGANTNVKKNLATPTVLVVTIYIRFAAYPAASGCSLVYIGVTAGKALAINYNTATNRFYARFSGGADGNTAAVDIALDTWYRLDMKFDVSANPSKIDFAVNGTAAAQSSYAQAATTFVTLGIGQHDAVNVNVYYDDSIYSVTAADYPIGAFQVEGLLPNADGTHNNAANIIEDNDGNDVGAVTAYDHVNQLPMSESTLYLRQAGNGVANYAEVAFADPINYTAYLGVMGILAYASADTAANEGACVVIRSDATAITLWGTAASRADYSESSVFYKSALITAPAGGWTLAEIGALVARLGYSNDADPDPYWHNLMLEVASNGVTVQPPRTMHQFRQRRT